jgi:hypothetical protein
MSRQPDDGSWEEEAMFNMSKEIEKLNTDIRMMIDLNKSYRWNNGVLIVVIIGLVIWIATG